MCYFSWNVNIFTIFLLLAKQQLAECCCGMLNYLGKKHFWIFLNFNSFEILITPLRYFSCQSNALWKKNMWHHRSSRHNAMKTTVCLLNECVNCPGWHAYAQSAFILDLPESLLAHLFVENKNSFPATPNFLWLTCTRIPNAALNLCSKCRPSRALPFFHALANWMRANFQEATRHGCQWPAIIN